MFSFILIVGILHELYFSSHSVAGSSLFMNRDCFNIIHVGSFTNQEQSAVPRFIELFVRKRLLFEFPDDILVTCDVKKEDL